MATDALNYSVIIRELDNALRGGKVTRLIQPEKDELLLTIYKNRENLKLLLCANSNVCRVHLTSNNYNAPQTAPSFCMLLRKHLLNATVEKVEQQPFERAADFSLTAYNELGYPYSCHLIIELTGKSANIILTDGEYKIFDTLKRSSLDSISERKLLPGLIYTFLPSQNKIAPDDYVRLAALVAQSGDPKSAFSDKVMGVGKDTLNEILFELPTSPSPKDIKQAFSSYTDSLHNTTPNIVVDKNGVYLDVFPVVFRSKTANKEFYSTFNQAFDAFYGKKDKFQRYAEKSRHISTIIKNALSRTEKKIAIQKEALLDAEKSTQFQDYGNLILSNIYKISKGCDSLTTENFYSDGSLVTIPLDATKTPQQNAQIYFKKSSKFKKTAEYTVKMLAENQDTLGYLISLSESLKYSTEATDLEQIYNELAENNLLRGNKSTSNGKTTAKKAKQQPIRPLEYSIDGYTIYAGKNNIQNAYITFTLASSNDLWLHTKDIHSSHVVICNPDNGSIPDAIIQVAAEITAFYSQARNSGKTAIDITQKKFVKKPSGAKTGFVHYTNQTTVIVSACEHANLLRTKT